MITEVIRNAVMEDIPDVICMHEELYKAEVEAAGVPVEHAEAQISSWKPREWRIENWSRGLTTDDSLFFKVVEVDEELVGLFVGVLQPESDMARISRINLHPKVQGRGIGTRLVTQFHGKVPRERRINLLVLESNSNAIHFYQGLGYTATGKVEDTEIGGYKTKRIEMERKGVML